jgi:SAM-dependent methyltransferase
MDYKKFQEYEQRAHSTVYSESIGGFHDDLIPQIVERFVPEFQLSLDAKIIDIGCGPGLFALAAQKLGYHHVTGVTLSQEDVDACTKSGIRTVHASMTDLPWNDNTVDFVWCRHALEHSPYPLFTLYEFNRVLRTGGRVFIEVPAPNNERAFMHEYNPNHYSIMGERMWMALFEKAGFESFAFWNYEIDLPFDNQTVKERSLMFGIEKKR